MFKNLWEKITGKKKQPPLNQPVRPTPQAPATPAFIPKASAQSREKARWDGGEERRKSEQRRIDDIRRTDEMTAYDTFPHQPHFRTPEPTYEPPAHHHHHHSHDHGHHHSSHDHGSSSSSYDSGSSSSSCDSGGGGCGGGGD